LASTFNDDFLLPIHHSLLTIHHLIPRHYKYPHKHMTTPPASADTIFARASGPGRAGVAVYRLSGPQSHRIARAAT